MGRTGQRSAAARAAGSLKRVRILEPAAFAAVLGELVRDEFGGSVNAARGSLGLPLVTLQRLASGKKRLLGEATLRALYGGLKAHFRSEPSTAADYIDRLDRTLIGARGRARLDDYEYWKREWRKRYFDRRWRRASTQAGPDEWDAGAHTDRRIEAERVVSELDRRFGGVLKAFTKQMLERGHEKDRVEISVLRVIEPLLDSRIAGRIERDYSVMSPRSRDWRELKRFIEWGIARERFMLDREPAERVVAEALEYEVDTPFDDLFAEVMATKNKDYASAARPKGSFATGAYPDRRRKK